MKQTLRPTALKATHRGDRTGRAAAALLALLVAVVVGSMGCQPDATPLPHATTPDDAATNNVGWPDDATDPHHDTDDMIPTDDAPHTTEALRWEACDLYSAGGGPAAECSRLAMPIFWGEVDSQTIPVFVKRLRAVEPRRGQLWLLQGGPGGSGEGMETLAEKFAARHPDLDLYIPDHRGTGRSARLSCTVAERFDTRGSAVIVADEWPACIDAIEDAWGIYLDGFTTTAAARDLGEWIHRTREPLDEVLVLGVSYGTFWAHRYLKLFPDQPTAIILDSICSPGACTMPGYDARFNETAHGFFDRQCADDPICREKLGADPWSKVAAVFTKMEQGACPQLFDMGINRQTLRTSLGVLFRDWRLRVYLPAVVYRIERCSEGDVRALLAFSEALGLQESFVFMDPGLDSDILGSHILFSELWDEPAPSLDVIEQAAQRAFVSLDVAYDVAWLYEPWPRYPRDPMVDQWAVASLPMLMLNGTLDPQTPMEVAEPARARFTDGHQTFVTIPNAAHATLIQSPTVGGGQCGMMVTDSFLDNPEGRLDLSCLNDLEPIDFNGVPAYSQFLFGEADMWENARAKGEGDRLQGVEPPGLARAREFIRRPWRGPFELP